MWPWEHLAVGYLAYSAYVRARTGGPPDGRAVVAVAVGSQFPDLLDKPLAWTFGVVPAGYSVGHSVLVAIPVAALIVWAARRAGRGPVGVGFAVGYLAHLPGDLLYQYAVAGRLNPAIVLWPLVRLPPTEPGGGVLAHLVGYLRAYLAMAGAGRLTIILLAELALVATALAVWVLDGRPGFRPVRPHKADGGE